MLPRISTGPGAKPLTTEREKLWARANALKTETAQLHAAAFASGDHELIRKLQGTPPSARMSHSS
jgi:hypothetical protein